MGGILNSSFMLQLFFAFTLYFTSLAFYRLFLDPLAKFPGPKLAALTRYYEAYYDLIRNGQYTFKIAELHKKYGILAIFTTLYLFSHSSVKVQSRESVHSNFT